MHRVCQREGSYRRASCTIPTLTASAYSRPLLAIIAANSALLRYPYIDPPRQPSQPHGSVGLAVNLGLRCSPFGCHENAGNFTCSTMENPVVLPPVRRICRQGSSKYRIPVGHGYPKLRVTKMSTLPIQHVICQRLTSCSNHVTERRLCRNWIQPSLQEMLAEKQLWPKPRYTLKPNLKYGQAWKKAQMTSNRLYRTATSNYFKLRQRGIPDHH